MLAWRGRQRRIDAARPARLASSRPPLLGRFHGRLGGRIRCAPFASQRATLESISESVQGKIVVDVTVPLVPPKVARVQLPAEGSAGQIAQAILGEGVHVVSAFQNVAAAHLQSDDAIACDVLVCGNSKEARQTVIDLISAIGMTGFHAGLINNAAAAEALTSVLINLNKQYKTHAGIKITGIS